MRIEVVVEPQASGAHARAYAEYRLFAVLARYRRYAHSARVVLGSGEGGGVTCAVAVRLEPRGHARTRASGRHAYGAIDRAARRIGERMEKLSGKRSGVRS